MRAFLALGLMTGLVAAAGTAYASTPPTSNITVPSTIGQTVSVTWTGTIPPLTNATSDCTNLADTAAVDQHLPTVNVPAGVYDTLQAQFTFNITWTPVVNINTSDEILTVLGPGGVGIGSSDGGSPSETVLGANLVAGAYKVIACGFANAQPQPYTGRLTIATVASGGPVASELWNFVSHGACCEGNSAAYGNNNFVLAPTLLTANSIYKSSDSGRTWRKVYPPVDISVPFGIEGDLAAFGSDVVYFGTELAAGAVAFSRDAGETWTNVQVPVVPAVNDQAWLYLGPMPDVCPVQLAPYVLTGWFRIGANAVFSCDGGVTWPIQTPLVGVDGSGPNHVVCLETAHAPMAPSDTRISNPDFARMKGVRHGNWGTDRRFYWSQVSGGNFYVCKTDNFGATWEGIVHPLAAGTASPGNVITALAFDQKGTLYLTQSNKLYVSFDQGESVKYAHTLPRWGPNAADGAGQAIVVDNGTVHVALRQNDGQVWYLRGDGADTATPVWRQELVNTVLPTVRLDFIQIVLNGKGVPTIGYTDSLGDTATSSRDLEPIAVADSATTSQERPVTINVLANDSDPDGDPLTVTSVSDPPQGSAVNNGDGTVTYTPDAGFTGIDSFTYTIEDGFGGSDSATVTVTVNEDCALIDDSNGAVEYKHGWHKKSNAQASNGGYHQRNGQNNGGSTPTARVVFNATSITYVYVKTPAAGAADVYIDGVLRETVSYASGTNAATFGHRITYSGLTLADHEFKLAHRSGVVTVDGFEFGCAGSGANPSAAESGSVTSTSTASSGEGPVIERTVSVGSLDRDVSVVVEGSAVPLTVRLLDPAGNVIATGEALISGLTVSGLDKPVSAPGVYRVQVVNLPGAFTTIEISVARTVAVQ